MTKSTTLIVRCCYHPKNFGTEFIIGTKDGKGVEGTTDGICPDCYKIEKSKIGRKVKHNEESIQKESETGTKARPGN